MMTESFDKHDPAFLDQPQTHLLQEAVSVALRRKSLVVLGIVACLVVGTLYYAQATPLYKSAAQVLVIKKRPDASPIGGGDSRVTLYDDYLTTHQTLIRSPLIIGRALKLPEFQKLKSFAGLADPTALLVGSLTVGRDTKDNGANSDVLTLTFRGKEPDETGKVLNAVIASYKDFLDETYRKSSGDTLEIITKTLDLLEKDLAQKEQEYRDFRRKTPLFNRSRDGGTVHHERLEAIEAKRSALLVRRLEIQGKLAAVEKARLDPKRRDILPAIVPEPAGRANMAGGKRQLTTSALEDQLLPLLLQEQQLAEDYGPDHPLVQSVRKRLQLTREFIAKANGRKTPEEINKDEALFADPVELYVQALRQELSDMGVEEQLLADQFKEEYESAKNLTDFAIQEEALRGEIARNQQRYNSTIKRLQEINVIRDYGGYEAQIISPASIGKQVEPRAFVIFGVATVLGLCSGIGLAFVAEKTDKSFRNPEEIRRRLGLPVVGHIPLFEPAENVMAEDGVAALDASLCTYYRSRSSEAEAFRGVRTALYFNTFGKDCRVIQVTSPSMGDGKSTLAANLAVSIAQSNKRVLFVDADFRRPRAHRLFGLEGRVGLAGVIAGDAALKEALQATAVPNLDVLPVGPLPPNPAELLSAPRFQEILTELRDRYDFVLVDTPPLLAVTDPSAVAPRVDGVLLNIRVSRNGRPSAERAKEMLTGLGATVLGVVVNGVTSGTGNGYSGYYQSGYYQYSSEYESHPEAMPAASETMAASGSHNDELLAPVERAASRNGHSHSSRHTRS